MTRESDWFEQRIEGLHQLLEQKGSKITWNDRVPDPDNPTQSRQIDVTIRRDGKLTAVECRIHQEAQDVKWIEELIGRRASLRADTIIAVSASGFTEGAVKKAIAFGIILRDFDTLTSEEVRDWGKKRKIKLEFYQFTENILDVTLPVLPPQMVVMTDPTGAPFDWMPLLSKTKSWLAENRKTVGTAPRRLTMRGIEAQCLFGGMKALRIDFSTCVRRLLRNVSTTSVVAYADTATEHKRQALVGRFNLGRSEIFERDDDALVALDMTNIKLPKNSIFGSVMLDMGRPVTMRSFRIYGTANIPLSANNLLDVRFHLPSQAPNLIPIVEP